MSQPTSHPTSHPNSKPDCATKDCARRNSKSHGIRRIPEPYELAHCIEYRYLEGPHFWYRESNLPQQNWPCQYINPLQLHPSPFYYWWFKQKGQYHISTTHIGEQGEHARDSAHPSRQPGQETNNDKPRSENATNSGSEDVVCTLAPKTTQRTTFRAQIRNIVASKQFCSQPAAEKIDHVEIWLPKKGGVTITSTWSGDDPAVASTPMQGKDAEHIQPESQVIPKDVDVKILQTAVFNYLPHEDSFEPNLNYFSIMRGSDKRLNHSSQPTHTAESVVAAVSAIDRINRRAPSCSHV